MAIISVTPILGYSETLEAENYPYFGAGRGATPQLGTTIDVIDTDTDTPGTSTMEETGVGTGIFHWSTPV